MIKLSFGVSCILWHPICCPLIPYTFPSLCTMPVKRFGVLAGRFFGSEVLTDWTVTSTSMNLFMWFKLEELATHIPVPLLFLPCRFRTLSKVSTRRSATWTPGNTCCGRNKLIDSFLVVSFIMTKCDHSSPQSVFPRVPLLVWFQLPGAEKNSASLPICTGYRILASLLSYVLRLSVVWLECA